MESVNFLWNPTESSLENPAIQGLELLKKMIKLCFLKKFN